MPSNRSAVFTDVLPLIDGAIALVSASVIMGVAPGSFLFAIAAPAVIALIAGYHRPPVGGLEVFRSFLLLLVAAIVAQWIAFQTTEALLHTGFRGGVGVVCASVAGWSLVRRVRAFIHNRRPERVVVLGSGIVAERLVATLRRHRNRSMDLVGYIDEQPGESALPALGGLDDLRRLVAAGEVDRLIVAFSGAIADADMLEALRDSDAYGVHVDVVPRLFEYLGTDTRRYAVGSLPLVTVRGRGGRYASRFAKRGFDVVASGSLLLLTLPVSAAVAAAVWLEDRGPVFYRQERIGRGGRRFSILKFRSMRNEPEDIAHVTRVTVGAADISAVVANVKIAGVRRVTRVGDVIRRTSLDEIPQLWNVLRGDMSMVGPRPLRDFEVAALTPWESSRQLERPGITGLWQVTGRSDVTWEERMLLDYEYVRHWSLARDAEILLRTLPAVLAGSGAR